MELSTKNIHMDRIKSETQTQVALEDDINIADVKPDVFQLVTEKGEARVEEIRALEDHVHVKGKLYFCVLYISDEDVHHPACMEGALPFEEKLFVKGAVPGDNVTAEAALEDLSVGMINSRKLSVQALVRLTVCAEGTMDTLLAVDVEGPDCVEVQKKTLQALNLAIQKKDIFRVKKELDLPNGMPNVFQMLWQTCRLKNLSFGIGEESLRLQGELELFFLYEGEGENRPVMWYETELPLSGTVECQGMRADMLEDISCRIGHKEIEVKADEDGEERKIGLELVLDLDMKLYEEIQMEMLSDIYGVTREVEALRQMGQFKRLVTKNTGKAKVSGRLQALPGAPEIQKICSASGEILLDRIEPGAEGLQIEGILEVRALCTAQDGEMPFYGMKGSIPFSYTLEVPQAESADLVWRIEPALDGIQAARNDAGEAEVKAQISLKGFLCRQMQEPVVTDLQVRELDPGRVNSLPGIVAYIVREGDSLWNIGKRYYVPVRALREMNDLNGEDVKPGDRVLIVKGA